MVIGTETWPNEALTLRLPGSGERRGEGGKGGGGDRVGHSELQGRKRWANEETRNC